jgi:transglutaminase-like putative cysteine protease
MARRLLLALLAAALLGGAAAPRAEAPVARRFHFTYEVRLQPPSDARRLVLWLPYPHGDAHQEIGHVAVAAPLPTKVTKDPVQGNDVLSIATENWGGKPLAVTVSYDVLRREYVHRPGQAQGAAGASAAKEGDLRPWLEPDSHGALSERIRGMAREITAGKTGDAAKARAIYDYVVSTMKYDKSGTGWGNGDIVWACDAKRGNCTDFHALFMGLARSVGIPARFSIGFPLPPERGSGEIPGYHCWAEFHLKGEGWIPVDASEAAKHPEKRDYFFGAHDENRVQLSVGRDLVLAPPQLGEPLNYFVYPYVEVDGKPFTQVEKSFRYADLD